MRKDRLAAVALVALALAPGTFLRSPLPDRSSVEMVVSRVQDLPELATSCGFTRESLWQLSSEHSWFGGYSAMLLPGDGTVRAFSDRGRILTFTAPQAPYRVQAEFDKVRDRGRLSYETPDIEAATRDPVTGDFWLAFENTHAVIRYSASGEFGAARKPPEWQGWYENSGAEAFALLPDGRFLVLPEQAATGLLYSSDPAEEVEPLTFGFATPDGYSPTDMAALPDGRVLVLLRRVDWAVPPFAFASAIAIADPTALQEGSTLDLGLLLELDVILPRENYEAIALAGVEEDGTVQLWLMSDDNLASFQRTLLAQVSWREEANGPCDSQQAHEKAREE